MSDLWGTVIVGVAGAIAGGGFWAFLSKRAEIGAGERSADYTRLTKEFAELRRQHAACEQRCERFENRLRAVEHSRDSYLARWVKDGKKRVTWCNDKAFLMIFAPLGISREEMDGRTFSDLLIDRNAAEEIDMLDHEALAHPGTVASALVQLHPQLPPMMILKIAAIGPEGGLAFEGYAFLPNDPEIRAAAGSRRMIRQIGASASHLIDGNEP